MNLTLHSGALSSSHVRYKFTATRALPVSAKIAEPEVVLRRRLVLRKVDRELSRGNYKTALKLVKHLQRKLGDLRGFGTAKQVPRSISSLDQLKLSGVDTSFPQSLVDAILDSIKRSTDLQLSEEVWESQLESLTHESASDNHLTNAQHEAGHFLVGYLLGALPKRYFVSNVGALTQDEGIGGGVEFIGFEFLGEDDARGILQMELSREKRNGTLNKFLCVVLGGLVADHLVFGYSEGHHDDVEKMNEVFQWMGFQESEIDSRLKWAVMNTLSILVRHQEARSRLAETMALGKSVGSCIDVIENYLNDVEL